MLVRQHVRFPPQFVTFNVVMTIAKSSPAANNPIADIRSIWKSWGMNKHDVRREEIAMRREWAERQNSETLRQILAEKTLGSGHLSAAREVLQERGEAN